MSLTVEDGTGLTDADALVSVAFCDTYHDDRGNTAWLSTSSPVDEDKEQAIRRASDFLNNSYLWAGYKVSGRDQAMSWPRNDVVDAQGWAVAADSVPIEIKYACAEIALRELVSPGSMQPDVTLADKVKREKVGPLEVEYANVSTAASASRPVLLIVNDLVSGLLARGSNNPLVGVAVRG